VTVRTPKLASEMVERPDWSGRTVVCIASGPSLTSEDCEMVRAAGHPVVVTNTTFRLCPWADTLYAYDTHWWKRYHEEAKAGFSGRRFAAYPAAANYGAEPSLGLPWMRTFHNSGACAISLAVAGCAAKIVMLGYDAGMGPAGETHWHGDHPQELSNAASMSAWPLQFKLAARDAQRKGVAVVNASRRTRLTCFPRGELEAEL